MKKIFKLQTDPGGMEFFTMKYLIVDTLEEAKEKAVEVVGDQFITHPDYYRLVEIDPKYIHA
jgi:hypothetical protein